MAALDWDDFRVFSSVHRAGSVRSAARDLGVHPSTVARRLEQFERRLGVMLFNRTPEGLRITPEGLEVAEAVAGVAAELDAVEQRLRGRDALLAGHIRLVVPESLALSFLVGALARFERDHPGVVLELIPSSRDPDLTRREADIAIRVTNHPQDSLVGRQLGRFALAVYGQRGNRTADGLPWVDWTGVTRLGLSREPAGAGRPVAMCTASVVLAHAAIESGMGVGYLPCVLADGNASLTRLEGQQPVGGHEIWMLTHPDLRAVARVRVLMQFLVEAFRAQRELLAGDCPRDDHG